MISFPRVTIITPSFNQGSFLEATIESVLNQSYPNLEYIIIDGGSTDNSIDIIKKHEKDITYWVSEKDKGQSHAINKGLRISTGKYINWLNSDDILLPHSLSKLISFLEDNAGISCVYGNTIFIDYNGKELFRRREIPFDANIITYAMNYLPQPSALFRREVINKIGLLDERFHYCMDHELWLRMNKEGFKFQHINFFVSGYRLHLASKGIINPSQIKIEQLFLKQKYREHYPKFIQTAVYFFKNIIYRIKRKVISFKLYGTTEILPGSIRRILYKSTGKL